MLVTQLPCEVLGILSGKQLNDIYKKFKIDRYLQIHVGWTGANIAAVSLFPFYPALSFALFHLHSP